MNKLIVAYINTHMLDAGTAIKAKRPSRRVANRFWPLNTPARIGRRRCEVQLFAHLSKDISRKA